jgi:hypothetical protein
MNYFTKFLIFTLLLPVVALAENYSEVIPQNLKDFKYPKSGVIVVPVAQYDVPPELKSELEDNLKQIKEKGYYDSRSPYPQFLLSMKGKDMVALQNKNSKSLTDPLDTHMKHKISEVGVAFAYPGISPIGNNLIGYTAGGMYINDKGWTGVKEFFESEELGVCSFTLYNMALSHGNVRVSDDSVNYKINKKVGTTEVYGSKLTGINYNVSWYDNTYIHELDCASLTYDKSMLDKMFVFASQVDTKLSLALSY